MKRATEVVLDSNVVNRISRAPTSPPSDRLSGAIENRQLQVCVDAGQGIVHEWEKTANRDVVRQLIIHWQQFKGWKFVDLIKPLPPQVRRTLLRLCFKDTGDKLILRTAYNTADRRVVSDDPDFWDPMDTRSKGDARAPVAALCRDQLGVIVATLKDALDELAPRT
jgi:hypothetical protein